MDWPAVLTLFLTASVEWVEAFTIVLAVSLTIGWGAAIGAAAAGLATLTLLTAATGGALSLGLDLRLLQFIIGIFLLFEQTFQAIASSLTPFTFSSVGHFILLK